MTAVRARGVLLSLFPVDQPFTQRTLQHGVHHRRHHGQRRQRQQERLQRQAREQRGAPQGEYREAGRLQGAAPGGIGLGPSFLGWGSS